MSRWYNRLKNKSPDTPEPRTDSIDTLHIMSTLAVLPPDVSVKKINPESARLAFDELTGFLMADHGMSGEQARRQTYESLFGGERRQERIREAARSYRERGWVQIYSGYLGAVIYLVKNESVATPDPGIPRYTEAECSALAGLDIEEIRTMHEAKNIFGGIIR